jgi:hypothetical protein
MHTTVRIYRGAYGLIDAVAARSAELQELYEQVPGFISYRLMKTPDGALSVTTCSDKEGADESNRVAKAWLLENLPSFEANPEVIEGESVMHFVRQSVPV